MPLNHEEYVTTKRCDEKTQVGRWLLGLLFGMAALFFTVTVYALDLSMKANRETNDVLRLVEKHIAGEAAAEHALQERLERIQADVRETRDLVVKILQDRRSVKTDNEAFKEETAKK